MSVQSIKSMDVEKAQRQISMIRQFSLITGLFFAVLLFCLWRAPVSPSYLVVAAGFGLGCALLVFFTRLKTHLDLMLAIFPMLTIIVQLIAQYAFFLRTDPNAWAWRVAFQFFGIVFVTFYGSAWIFRHRITASLLKAADQ